MAAKVFPLPVWSLSAFGPSPALPDQGLPFPQLASSAAQISWRAEADPRPTVVCLFSSRS